jgi:hypothetical protein
VKNPAIALRRKFFRELPEYEVFLRDQGTACKICRRPPGTRRLSVDHDHAVDKVKVRVGFNDANACGEYIAVSDKYKNMVYCGYGKTKKEAWKNCKLILFQASIRGLLCFLCNGGIQHFEDSKAPLTPAERFDNAAKYFRDFEGSFNGPGN